MGDTDLAKSERWWTWHWDREDADNIMLPAEKITRWRRGSFLTVYRIQMEKQVQWWFYGPFNLAIAFGRDV